MSYIAALNFIASHFSSVTITTLCQCDTLAFTSVEMRQSCLIGHMSLIIDIRAFKRTYSQSLFMITTGMPKSSRNAKNFVVAMSCKNKCKMTLVSGMFLFTRYAALTARSSTGNRVLDQVQLHSIPLLK